MILQTRPNSNHPRKHDALRNVALQHSTAHRPTAHWNRAILYSVLFASVNRWLHRDHVCWGKQERKWIAPLKPYINHSSTKRAWFANAWMQLHLQTAYQMPPVDQSVHATSRKIENLLKPNTPQHNHIVEAWKSRPPTAEELTNLLKGNIINLRKQITDADKRCPC